MSEKTKEEKAVDEIKKFAEIAMEFSVELIKVVTRLEVLSAAAKEERES